MPTHGTLLTLYCLVIGTLLTGAAMTLLERHGRPRHGDPLLFWSAGYGLLASGCALAALRLTISVPRLPAASLAVAANTLILAGYLAVLLGIARLDRRRRLGFSSVVLGINTLAWLFWGLDHVAAMWAFGCGAQIALVCALAAFDISRNRNFGGMRSVPAVVTICSVHAAIYLARSTALPLLAPLLSPKQMGLVAVVTMYEGVVFSVALPTSLLLLLREESQGRLNTALLTDYLTGLGNRQRLCEALPGMVASADGRRVALLLFDLDRFKQINDRHGHAAGDLVLRCFAGTGSGVLGPDAVFVRLGGEEFVAILPVADITEAALTAETVLKRFAALPTIVAGLSIPATASAGVTLIDPDCRSPDEPLHLADNALYEAKERGRNRVVVAHPTPSAEASAISAETDLRPPPGPGKADLSGQGSTPTHLWRNLGQGSIVLRILS
ncbi:GGDEF domain-containing protein [Acetobacteraceae bacterium KSS8]|uniref:diguanylate cyclase n=1 Tax=Endosaccharibacter trunci TaxID=2812733 RepID=A0ABT1W5E6_9PROT|nr:GGDEF domain-containing protein [Acetobacteraceae bacterium KSS8]